MNRYIVHYFVRAHLKMPSTDIVYEAINVDYSVYYNIFY